MIFNIALLVFATILAFWISAICGGVTSLILIPSIINNFDRILLEKVFKLGSKPSYEFYCYKGNQLTKYDFDEEA